LTVLCTRVLMCPFQIAGCAFPPVVCSCVYSTVAKHCTQKYPHRDPSRIAREPRHHHTHRSSGLQITVRRSLLIIDACDASCAVLHPVDKEGYPETKLGITALHHHVAKGLPLSP
jgi:hypothetical protein